MPYCIWVEPVGNLPLMDPHLLGCTGASRVGRPEWPIADRRRPNRARTAVSCRMAATGAALSADTAGSDSQSRAPRIGNRPFMDPHLLGCAGASVVGPGEWQIPDEDAGLRGQRPAPAPARAATREIVAIA